MENKKREVGSSNAPLILGIIASILNIPAMFISAIWGSAIQFLGNLLDSSSVSGIGGTIILLSILAILTGFTGSLMSKSNPGAGGGFLLIASIVSVLILFMTFNFLQLVVMVLYVIATIITYTQTKIVTDESGTPLVNPNEKTIKINIEHIPQYPPQPQQESPRSSPQPTTEHIVLPQNTPPKNKTGNPYA
jgi:hypothetical protein